MVLPEGEGGRQTLVEEDVWEADAPAGKLVTVEYQDVVLKARHVRAEIKRKVVTADGDVEVRQGNNVLRGERIDLDLESKTGVVTAGSVDLDGGIHLKGELIAKVGPRTFTLEGASLSSCEGAHPAWEFRFTRGRVTLDDYARLTAVHWRLGGVPLLYLPYMLWPALRDRASGFLIPAIGYSSSRGGLLGLSYFQTLGRSADATFLLEPYSKGPIGMGVELRARASEGTAFEGTYYAARDTTLETDWGWKTRGLLKADDLARGLRGVASWLDFSSIEFFQAWERDFGLSATRSVRSEAFLTWTRDPVSANLRWNREDALFGSYDVITERRPVLELRLRPTPLLDQHVFAEADVSAGILRAERGLGQPSGQYDRVDVYPRVNVPLSPLPWLSSQASAGYRFTSYGASVSPDGTTLLDDRYDRGFFTAGLELVGPSFSRIFESGFGPFTRLKHVLEPRFDWTYVTQPDGLEKTPQFDTVDFMRPENSMRYALVQRLLAKGKSGAAQEIGSLEIGRTYYFQFPPVSTNSGILTPQSNSPLDVILRVAGGAGLNLDARTTFDESVSRMTQVSVTASASGRDRALAFSLFTSRPAGDSPSSTQLRLVGGTPIVPKKLRVDLQVAWDFSGHKLLEGRGLLTYEAACFKILAEYRDLRIGVAPSRDVRIGISLKNIGSFLDVPISLP